MKNKKKILSFIACLSLLSSCNRAVTPSNNSSISEPSVDPTPTPEEKIDYSKVFEIEEDSTISLISIKDEYSSKVKNVVIPEYIDGKKVSTIKADALRRNEYITTVFIPKSVESIEYGALKGLPNLEEVKIDIDNKYYYVKDNCIMEKVSTIDSTTGKRIYTGEIRIISAYKDIKIPLEITRIANAYLSETNVETVTLHSNLTIDQSTFWSMNKLSNIYLNGNTKYKVEGNCLYVANSTTVALAAWGDVIYPECLTTLRLRYMTSVTSVVLHDKITNISTWAFENSNLKKLHLPSSIENIPHDAFTRWKNIEEITIDDNPNFYVKGNCLLRKTALNNNQIIVGWKNVEIPDEITTINSLSFAQNYSINTIKLGKNIDTIENYSGTIYEPFSRINEYREPKDYFKFVDNEENTKYRIKGNCIVTNSDTDYETVVFALADENGVISTPSTSKIFDAFTGNFSLLNNIKDINSIKFNEGMTTLKYKTYFSINSPTNPLDIVLPSSLSSFEGTSSVWQNMFVKCTNINSISFSNGTNEGENYKVEGNCLIKKQGFSDGSDKYVFGYGDIVIPESVTNLADGNYTNQFCYHTAITSITLHNKFKQIEYQVFKDINSISSLKCINYIGSISDFKTFEIKNTRNDPVGLTMFQTIKISSGANDNVLINFLDNEGNITSSHLLKDLETIDE